MSLTVSTGHEAKRTTFSATLPRRTCWSPIRPWVPMTMRTLGKGDLLGEVALFRAGPHSATAVATERVTLLVIPADRLEEMVRTNPRLAMALIRQLARMAAGEDSAAGGR